MYTLIFSARDEMDKYNFIHSLLDTYYDFQVNGLNVIIDNIVDHDEAYEIHDELLEHGKGLFEIKKQIKHPQL